MTDDFPLPDLTNAPGLGLEPPEAGVQDDQSYQVLARKYRPQNFEDMVGQEAMVRIIRRAFELNRVAHAFMLTGVRGVGKTTTARIIARAFNCIGIDGKGGPTADPCGKCSECLAILQGRHPDVLELDAASRTGVDDVREIIEGAQFPPIQGRMKVFIIDEVHMLSRNAFNALLKTLEEPPARVSFIFATTEIRKVPVTVLSRCQRFDLRRVPEDMLAAYFGGIAQKEGVQIDRAALGVLARAADGSVRDGLSLLDQAIAQGATDEAQIVQMLGLADRGQIFDLLEAAMRGDIASVLQIAAESYSLGVDIGLLLTDLMGAIHLVSRFLALPALRNSADIPQLDLERGTALADQLSQGALSRAWQILRQGLNELQDSPDRQQAGEMILIRLTYAAGLPTPDALIRQLEGQKPAPLGGAVPSAPSAPKSLSSPSPRPAPAGSGEEQPVKMAVNGAPPAPFPRSARKEAPQTELEWRDIVQAAGRAGDPILHASLCSAVHPVQCRAGYLAVRIDLAEKSERSRIFRKLTALVEEAFPEHQWEVSESADAGEKTIEQRGAEIIELNRRRALKNPLVAETLRLFPGARIESVEDPRLDSYGLPARGRESLWKKREEDAEDGAEESEAAVSAPEEREELE